MSNERGKFGLKWLFKNNDLPKELPEGVTDITIYIRRREQQRRSSSPEEVGRQVVERRQRAIQRAREKNTPPVKLIWHYPKG